MKTHKLVLVTGIAFILFSCGGMEKKSEAMDFKNSGINFPAPPPPPGNKEDGETGGKGSAEPIASTIERKLIKTGEISFQTKNISETRTNIKAALSSLKGYIAKENAFDYRENPSEELLVRIPAENFDKLIELIAKGAEEIDSKRIDIEDVTEQFIDVEARLKTKKELETKYRELLAKAGAMEDVLKIEKELNVIREEIESTEGRLKYLSNQVSFCTLTIRYYSNKPVGFNFGGKLGSALKDGGTGFLWFIIIVFQLWPLWLISGLIWFLIVKLIRRSRKRKNHSA